MKNNKGVLKILQMLLKEKKLEILSTKKFNNPFEMQRSFGKLRIVYYDVKKIQKSNFYLTKVLKRCRTQREKEQLVEVYDDALNSRFKKLSKDKPLY